MTKTYRTVEAHSLPAAPGTAGIIPTATSHETNSVGAAVEGSQAAMAGSNPRYPMMYVTSSNAESSVLPTATNSSEASTQTSTQYGYRHVEPVNGSHEAARAGPSSRYPMFHVTSSNVESESTSSTRPSFMAYLQNRSQKGSPAGSGDQNVQRAEVHPTQCDETAEIEMGFPLCREIEDLREEAAAAVQNSALTRPEAPNPQDQEELKGLREQIAEDEREADAEEVLDQRMKASQAEIDLLTMCEQRPDWRSKIPIPRVLYGNPQRRPEWAPRTVNESVDALDRHKRGTISLAEVSVEERRCGDANIGGVEGTGRWDGREDPVLIATTIESLEAKKKEFDEKLDIMSMTMLQYLGQLPESMKVEDQKLHDLEKNLVETIPARIRIQQVEGPYTLQSLEALMAKNDQDLAEVQKAMKLREEFEKREAALAHGRTTLAAEIDAAKHKRHEVEAELRRLAYWDVAGQNAKLKKEGQAHSEIQKMLQAIPPPYEGLLSLLEENDSDITIAQSIFVVGLAFNQQPWEVRRFDYRVSRRNQMIMDAYASDPLPGLGTERPPGNWVRARQLGDEKLRLLINEDLTKYMQSHGIRATTSLLRALSIRPFCTSNQKRLKDVLVSAIQQHQAENGSGDEHLVWGDIPISTSPSAAPVRLPIHSIAPARLPIFSMAGYSTKPPVTISPFVAPVAIYSAGPSASHTTRVPFFSQSQMPDDHCIVEHPSSEFAPFSRVGMDMRAYHYSDLISQSRSQPDVARNLDGQDTVTRRVQSLYSYTTPTSQTLEEGAEMIAEAAGEEDVNPKAELPGDSKTTQVDSGDLGKDCFGDEYKASDPSSGASLEQAVDADSQGVMADVETRKLDSSPAQPPHLKIKNTCKTMTYVIPLYAILWTYTYWGISQQIYPLQTRIFVGFRVLKDGYYLWKLPYNEWPASAAYSILFAKTLDYLGTIYLITWYGPIAALCTIWILPFVRRMTRWCWNRSASFHKDFPGISLMRGPFPSSEQSTRIERLASFGIDPNRATLSILWLTCRGVAYYFLTYIALFSHESDLARILAVMIYLLVSAPWLLRVPAVIEEAEMISHLTNREYYQQW